MIIYCEAVVENTTQQENLIECIEILGGNPQIKQDKISVEHEGIKDECDIFIALFEHYARHNITILES